MMSTSRHQVTVAEDRDTGNPPPPLQPPPSLSILLHLSASRCTTAQHVSSHSTRAQNGVYLLTLCPSCRRYTDTSNPLPPLHPPPTLYTLLHVLICMDTSQDSSISKSYDHHTDTNPLIQAPTTLPPSSTTLNCLNKQLTSRCYR